MNTYSGGGAWETAGRTSSRGAEALGDLDHRTPADKQRRQPNSKTIARLAGVSQTTVSRVLNGAPNVNEATRQRVLSAIDTVDYVPNVLARSLVTRRTTTIGLVVSNIANPFYPELVAEINAIASRHHLSVLLCNTQQEPGRQNEYARMLVEQRVLGMIVTSVMLHSPYVEGLIRRGFPVVLVNRYLPDVPSDAVLVDNHGGAVRAVNHLLELGHSRIAYVRGAANTSTNRDRERGYREALRVAGCPVDEDLILPGNYTWEAAYRAGARFLTLRDRPTAAIGADDTTAFGFIDALYDGGLTVPDDCAVIGFDDVQAAAYRMVGLTTVRQPVRRMAEEAMCLLLARIGGTAPPQPQQVVFPADLVVRRTCGGNPRWYVPPAPSPHLRSSGAGPRGQRRRPESKQPV